MGKCCLSPRQKIFPGGSGVSGVNESTPMPGHLLPAPALLWWRNGRWLESGHLRGLVLFRQIIAVVDMWKELWGSALHHLASSAWGLQLFAKTLATALVEKKKLRDHEKLAYRQNRVCSHRRPYK